MPGPRFATYFAIAESSAVASSSSIEASPARGLCRRRMRAELADLLEQLGNARTGRRLGLHDWRPPVVGRVGLQRQHCGDRLHEAIGAVAIHLVDDEDVGDLHDAGLQRL